MIVAGAYGYNIDIMVGFDLSGATAAELRVRVSGHAPWSIQATVHDAEERILRVAVAEGDFPIDRAGYAAMQSVVRYSAGRLRKTKQITEIISPSIPEPTP
jgi:hypothetical protein